MAKYDVVGFGIATIDHFGVVDRYPTEDSKQPLVDYTQQGGGTVATPLVACSRLGLSTAYLGRLGENDTSAAVELGLRREGVATDTSLRESEFEPPVALILVNPGNHSRTITWFRRASAEIDPARLGRDIIETSRALYIDAHEGAASHAAALWARKAGRLVVVDADNLTDGIRPVLPLANVVIGSERFAEMYTGDSDAERGAHRLHEDFGGICGITAGAGGSYIVTGDRAFHQPAFSVDVVDTTGAGDVYHGAFVRGLLAEWPPNDCARFAAAVAAMKCRALGGRAGIPSYADAVAFLHRRGETGLWSA